MKLAIHPNKNSFSERWIEFCNAYQIPYKLVNCYSNDIINELEDCSALLWHYSHTNYKDKLCANQILNSLAYRGLKIFPDYNTAWHFDDKVAQKYLLESIKAPIVPSFVFYDKKTALDWFNKQSLPIVFKLKGGSGSRNVSLINTKKEGYSKIKKAFGNGFSQYNKLDSLKERYRKYKLGKVNFQSVIKGLIRFIYPDEFTKMFHREKGYVYFQKFIPNNSFDLRIVIVAGKAFAIKRLTREGDFRASGSGHLIYDKNQIDLNCIKIAFDVNGKIQSQSIAFDFIFDKKNNPLIVEISYGYDLKAYDSCQGYWDEELNWFDEKVVPQHWMIQEIIK
jgi:glutathione synthase/RimK-type ligase-like ATP-grasp enzyme